jgi:predicted metal-dependent peptidase
VWYQYKKDENNIENSGAAGQELKEEWQGISEGILLDIESFSKEQGEDAGAMMQNIKNVTREKYDYSSFLRRFAVLSEAMRINDEEFDYIFYTYGLKLYEKMPLIEPLEYKEIRLIKDFVVAIDTSGSVSGNLVQAFLKKTYNILKQTESFFARINLYIIQCDAKIQEAVKIASPEEFENYLKNTKIKGLGGTDFRPVFDYVNTKIKEGELTNLRGLIYFTDGYGTFPETKPAYDAAFVFIDEIHGEFVQPTVPPWAIKLILKPEEME